MTRRSAPKVGFADGPKSAAAKGPRRSSSGRRGEPQRPKRPFSISRIAIVLVLIGGVGLIGYDIFRGRTGVGAGVVEPASLSPVASAGKVLFEANCAPCHGPKANGTDHGPPFVNDIYNPGHHPDEAFLFAARNGVRAHHWRFGNMPPLKGVTDADVSAIARYVRELQEANGIRFQPHVM